MESCEEHWVPLVVMEKMSYVPCQLEGALAAFGACFQSRVGHSLDVHGAL